MWDNLGRVAAEFAHLDRLHSLDTARPGPDDIVYDQHTYDVFHRLRLDVKPALLFTAHLANKVDKKVRQLSLPQTQGS